MKPGSAVQHGPVPGCTVRRRAAASAAVLRLREAVMAVMLPNLTRLFDVQGARMVRPDHAIIILVYDRRVTET
jgi:hypothetical protein